MSDPTGTTTPTEGTAPIIPGTIGQGHDEAALKALQDATLLLIAADENNQAQARVLQRLQTLLASIG